MKKVKCPYRCGYAYTYEKGALEELRANSSIGIEASQGYSLLSVVEYPLRAHIAENHGSHQLRQASQDRWWL